MTRVDKALEVHDQVTDELLAIRERTKRLYELARKFSPSNKARAKLMKSIEALDTARCEVSSALSMAEKGEMRV